MARSKNLEHAHSVLNSFRSLVKSLRLADRAGLRDHGLGAAQLFVLHELARESPLSVNDLAERTATDQSTVSVVVAKLIEKGYVARQRSEADARRLDLTLTTRGAQLARNLPPPIQHRLIEGVQQLSPARAKALAESLREICEVLGIAEAHPPMFMDEGPARATRSSSATEPSSHRGASAQPRAGQRRGRNRRGR